ncbi:MAG TPA: hypothetical protein VI318_13505 [Baekduia sp.]
MKLALAAGLALMLGAAGCGSSGEDDAQPPAAARVAVTGYLAALQHKDYNSACAALAGDAAKGLRDAALGGFRVRPGSASSRLAQVQAAHSRAATCPGVMALVAGESSASLHRVAAQAQSASLTWIGPARGGVASLGDQDWVVAHRDGRWRIAADNVLPASAD